MLGTYSGIAEEALPLRRRRLQFSRSCWMSRCGTLTDMDCTTGCYSLCWRFECSLFLFRRPYTTDVQLARHFGFIKRPNSCNVYFPPEWATRNLHSGRGGWRTRAPLTTFCAIIGKKDKNRTDLHSIAPSHDWGNRGRVHVKWSQ